MDKKKKEPQKPTEEISSTVTENNTTNNTTDTENNTITQQNEIQQNDIQQKNRRKFATKSATKQSKTTRTRCSYSSIFLPKNTDIIPSVLKRLFRRI